MVLRKVTVLLTTVVALLTLSVPPASAVHQPVSDPNDTRGALDIRKVDVWGIERPRFKIGTWGWWSARKIWDRGYLVVHFDSFGTGRFDYYALVRSTRYSLQGMLFRDYADRPDEVRAELNVWRKSKRNVSVRVPLSLLRFTRPAREWGWKVETLWTSRDCRNVCFDWGPDEGRIYEPQPGAGGG